jgi:hypothetical protein
MRTSNLPEAGTRGGRPFAGAPIAVDCPVDAPPLLATQRVDGLSINEVLCVRLQTALQGRSYRTIAAETATCPETVRRYMNGSPCSTGFVERACLAYNLNADWLLFGREPMTMSQSRTVVLQSIDAAAILSEIASRWALLEARLGDTDQSQRTK